MRSRKETRELAVCDRLNIQLIVASDDWRPSMIGEEDEELAVERT